MHQGDQSDESFLASLASRYGGFDIVIDDGSHIGAHVRASFRVLFPALRPDGWYVIEDLQTSYWDSHEGGPVGTPGTAVELIKSLVDRTQADSATRDIAELHLFDCIAFIQKAPALSTESGFSVSPKTARGRRVSARAPARTPANPDRKVSRSREPSTNRQAR